MKSSPNEASPLRVFFALAVSAPSLFRLGPEWQEGVHWASSTVERLVGHGNGAHVRLMTDRVPALREGLCLSDGLEETFASLGKRPICFINPFFAGLEAGDVEFALERFRETGKPVVALRRPFSHPLLFLRKRGRAPRGFARLDSNAWRHESSHFEFEGRRLELRRQNFPPVLGAAGALFIGTTRQFLSVNEILNWMTFADFELPQRASCDVSYRRERILHQLGTGREATASNGVRCVPPLKKSDGLSAAPLPAP